MRYFFELSYDGTDYHGWQRQPQVISVQEAIETALEKVLKQRLTIAGCGRTDAGVHARAYVAHVDFDQALEETFLLKLNYALPTDIAFHHFWEVNERKHAQFSATARTYHYYFHTSKDPFQDRFSTHLETPLQQLDWEAMQAAASLLLDHTEYRGCCKVPDRHDSTACHVSEARFVQVSENQFYFRITANRFLRGMVRLLVAQLIDIGRKKQTVGAFRDRLIAGKRPTHFNYAPPQGLFLDTVRYPDSSMV